MTTEAEIDGIVIGPTFLLGLNRELIMVMT